MVESNLNTLPESDPGYGQLFAILIRRRYWLLSGFCIALGIAAFQAWTTKPTYQSSLQLLVEPNYQGKQESGQASGADQRYADPNIEVDNATQLSLMKSSQLIQKAVNLLPEYKDLDVDKLKKFLSVTQVEGEKGSEKKTKIFEVTYSDNDPKKTQKVLQAMERVYKDYNREQQELRLVKGLAFINKELPNVRQNVINSEAELEQFRTNKKLIDPEVQAKALTESINALKIERRTNQAQYEDSLARYNALQQQVAKSPQEAIASSRLSQSTRYQALLNEIQKTDLAIAKERMRFTDDNPLIQKLLLQRQEQLSLLEQEGGRALGGNSPQLQDGREGLLTQGQLGTTDITLVTQLLDMQKNILGLRAREQTLAQKEQQLRTELDKLPTLIAQYNRLQPELKLKRETLDQLEKARQELSVEIARGGFDWEVVEKPLLGYKTGPKKPQMLLLGAVVGLMLGGIAAFLRETTDDAVRTSDDLQKQIALPLLGIIPELPKSKKTSPEIYLPFGKPKVLQPAMSEPIIKLPFGKPKVLAPWTIEVIHLPASWESLDLIYKNIQLLNSVSAINSLMVTSALTGEGKSTIALGLAISAARLHQRVLLIDADLRNPILHKKLNLPNDYGLSTLLSSDTTLPVQSSIHSSSSYIDVLTSGPTPIDSANLLSSPRMEELMEGFEKTYDLVLLDAPPVLGMVDAIITGSSCRGVVLVARIGKVTRNELTEARAMLSKLNIIGAIANGVGNPTNAYKT